MRVIHFSDLHLESNSAKNKLFTINPLLKTVKALDEAQKIDLIVFSGDLLDKGGASFDNVDEGFMDFYGNVISKICKSIDLNENKFIICPGNHDIVRSLDTIYSENGNKTTLKDSESVNTFINHIKTQKAKFGIERMRPYKEFEEILYTESEYCKMSYFETLFKYTIDSKKIGIAALNSSWRCYGDDDKGKLILGENQIINALNFFEDCDFRIAVMHHHFNELIEFDTILTEKLLHTHFDILFCGHVHSPSNKYVIDPQGKLLILVAPGTLASNIKTDSKNYSNGFSVIDINFDEAQINNTFYTYTFPATEFVLNTNISKDGTWNIDLPKSEEVEKQINRQRIMNSIKDEYIGRIDSHLLTFNTETDAPKCLTEIFVQPKLVYKELLGTDKEETIPNLNDILDNGENYLFFGTKESGKTTLLDKIVIDALNPINDIKFIPVYLEFSKISTDIVTNIREYISLSKDQTKNALAKHKFLLLVDNLIVSDEYQDLAKLRQLQQLQLTYQTNIKIIATYNILYENQLPEHYSLLSKFNFVTVTIKHFQSKQIRELTNKWFKNAELIDKPKKIETLINGFLALSLPRTPFTVSMFLWIIEKQQNYKPINNSTLIENFIEKLLNKHSKGEILSDKFDYQNKVRLLAGIAYLMLKEENENYSVSHATIVTFISQYLKRKEFDYNIEKILSDFIESGIFVKDNNNLRFRFTCFFEYFLVMKMGIDPEFKKEVLDSNNYLKYINEIDYFTGLNRDDAEILKIVVNRLEESYKDLKEKIDKSGPDIDDFFKQSVSNINITEDNVANIIPEYKATEDDFEQIDDQRLLSQKTENGVAKKRSASILESIAQNLILSLKVLKNSEEVEEENLKYNSYVKILKTSVYFPIFYKFYISFLLNKKLIPEKEKEVQFEILQFLPFYHELLLYQNMGTQKLAQTILRKIEEDNTSPGVSEFEKFMSVFLYADVRGKYYFEKLSEFINKANKKYIFDMSFAKIMNYYSFRSLDAESDLKYLNMIGDILIKAKGYKKDSKSRLMDQYKEKRGKDSTTQSN